MQQAIPALLASTLAIAAALFPTQNHAADLEVTLRGVHSSDGQALVAVHREVPGVGFPSDGGVVAGEARPAATEDIRFVFEALPPGDYAVAAFHDADDDGQLDANFAGMPTEGFGFSNDARGFMGPPTFEAAKISVGSNEETTRIVVTIECPESAR